MSFVTAQPEALSAAASALQTLGSTMAAQNMAAATPTTGVVPAAADEVSALQAAQFAAYGAWYQQVSAQAAVIHERLASILGASGGSYGETEAANQSATSSTSATSLSGLLSSLTGGSGSSSSTGAIDFAINGVQNFTAAASDMIPLGQGQFLPTGGTGAAAALDLADGVSAGPPPVAAEPAGSAGVPVLAGSSQASALGGASAPPSWVSGGVSEVSPEPATLAGADRGNPAPTTAPVTALPAGVSSAASAGSRATGFGAPRYGAKLTVMPKPV